MAETSSIESVVYVCRAEANRLRQLVQDLDDGVEPRRLDGLLRELGKCADTLSAALTRVSSFIDHIEGDEPDGPQDTPPQADARMLELVQRLKVAARFGVCDVCGGVLSKHSCIEAPPAEPDAHTIARTRQRADASDE